MTDDETAIRHLVTAWMEATKAGDTATVLSLMAEDVVFMVPGREPLGKAEFAAAADQMQGARIDGKSDILELVIAGDWAYLRSRLHVKMMPPGGNSVERSGYTLTIFRKQADGRWLLSRDANMLTAAPV